MASAASGASGFLLCDDATEFMRQQGEQTWEAANEAGGCTAGWADDCAQCGDGGGLRACCGYCHLVFHPACLDLPQDVENWDEVAFACGLCVTDAVAKPASTTQGARLMREARQWRATTAAAEARRAARDNEIRDEHEAIALFVEQRAGGAAAGKRSAASAPHDRRARAAAAAAAAAAEAGGQRRRRGCAAVRRHRDGGSRGRGGSNCWARRATSVWSVTAARTCGGTTCISPST